MSWWGWMSIGLLFLGAELFFVEADFFLVFIGASAVVTGLFALAASQLPLWVHWLVFALVSIVSMVAFRKRVYRALRRQVPDMVNDLVGEALRMPVEIAPGATGRVDHRGSTWRARNVGSGVIAAGDTVRVVSIDGITLNVEAAP
jgi:membrane protein implicated in regulation of membrane protease activity